jgi:hypothetical protein
MSVVINSISNFYAGEVFCFGGKAEIKKGK